MSNWSSNKGGRVLLGALGAFVLIAVIALMQRDETTSARIASTEGLLLSKSMQISKGKISASIHPEFNYSYTVNNTTYRGRWRGPLMPTEKDCLRFLEETKAERSNIAVFYDRKYPEKSSLNHDLYGPTWPWVIYLGLAIALIFAATRTSRIVIAQEREPRTLADDIRNSVTPQSGP